MPEPQSTAFFVLLMVIFGALMCWMVLAKHPVFRVLAACLAFIPAVFFGVAAVNKYYDYYQNWSSAIADITSQGAQTTAIHGPHITSAGGVTDLLHNYVYSKIAAQDGYTLELTVHGQASHLTRNVLVYLPPQYFQPAYRKYRFPVIELVHGFPGQPQDWITVVDITSTLRSLLKGGLAKPVVLVMPDANGARGVSLQCLNQAGGPQDATFMAQDVPQFIARTLRVWPFGRAWGIAGYSEGGYCAANLGLQYGYRYAFAGVLSGYFQPGPNQLSHPPRLVSPFGGNKKLLQKNTPTQELLNLPSGAQVPQFWIGAGKGDAMDVNNARMFQQLLQLRQPSVTLRLVPSGGHTMFTWRLLIPPMLEWMTPRLANNVLLAEARAKRIAYAKLHPGKKPTPSPKSSRTSPKPKRTARHSPRPRHTPKPRHSSRPAG